MLKDFSKVRVLIVGDVMLDRYWWGSVQRISPEAPVPVVRLSETSLKAGGAANVAANVAGLGAEAILVGVIGNDSEGEKFCGILETSGVSQKNLVTIEQRPTTVKTRVIAHSQQVVRIDQETKAPLAGREIERVWTKISEILKDVGVIIVSDYAKGVLTEDLLLRLITTAKKENKKILVDPKGKSYEKYKNATILTPNKREAAEACKIEEDAENAVQRAGETLLTELELEALLITLGEEGMRLFERERKESFYLPAMARKVFDVTGAGDTVIATLAVSIGAGLGFPEAADLANQAAGLVVEQIGTTAIRSEDLSKVTKKDN